ncbi:hypothetical protein C1645_880702 [Glomus cerebriforme]|uniref:Uncharacterized protein n=1 Tax=Glomus cerebriforme TaxID=658196 RepID=A0A397SGK8_9GLOM|nr:hypothetical protein C1645_880702 [Glomus cerebriforme]
MESTTKHPYHQTRAEWLIYKYGRAQALFHAVRLGESFITEEVVQGLIARGAIISRYFVQRLVMQFGVQHLESKIVSWAADLPLTAFTRLITEAVHQLNGDLGIRGNDMELFQHLTTCTFSINRIPTRFYEHLNEIEDLILNHKFIPFQPVQEFFLTSNTTHLKMDTNIVN